MRFQVPPKTFWLNGRITQYEWDGEFQTFAPKDQITNLQHINHMLIFLFYLSHIFTAHEHKCLFRSFQKKSEHAICSSDLDFKTDVSHTSAIGWGLQDVAYVMLFWHILRDLVSFGLLYFDLGGVWYTMRHMSNLQGVAKKYSLPLRFFEVFWVFSAIAWNFNAKFYRHIYYPTCIRTYNYFWLAFRVLNLAAL